MTTPPILEEIRRVRHAMSAEIGHDPKRIVEYYAAIQQRNADRLVNLVDQKKSGRTKHCIEVVNQPLPDGVSTQATR